MDRVTGCGWCQGLSPFPGVQPERTHAVLERSREHYVHSSPHSPDLATDPAEDQHPWPMLGARLCCLKLRMGSLVCSQVAMVKQPELRLRNPDCLRWDIPSDKSRNYPHSISQEKKPSFEYLSLSAMQTQDTIVQLVSQARWGNRKEDSHTPILVCILSFLTFLDYY